MKPDTDPEELNTGTAKVAPTYPEIKAYVLEHHGMKVSSLAIAQTKKKCGLETGEYYNLPFGRGRPPTQLKRKPPFGMRLSITDLSKTERQPLQIVAVVFFSLVLLQIGISLTIVGIAGQNLFTEISRPGISFFLQRLDPEYLPHQNFPLAPLPQQCLQPHPESGR